MAASLASLCDVCRCRTLCNVARKWNHDVPAAEVGILPHLSASHLRVTRRAPWLARTETGREGTRTTHSESCARVPWCCWRQGLLRLRRCLREFAWTRRQTPPQNAQHALSACTVITSLAAELLIPRPRLPAMSVVLDPSTTLGFNSAYLHAGPYSALASQ